MSFIVAGAAILLLNNRQGKPHLWFILTNPDAGGKVLAVMLRTKGPHTDNTTVLAVGEYPFGDPVEGVIDYRETRLFPEKRLVEWVQRSQAKLYQNLSELLLARILAGCLASGFSPNWVHEYLAPPPPAA